MPSFNYISIPDWTWKSTMKPSAQRLLNILVPVKRWASLYWYLLSSHLKLTHSAVDYSVKIRVNPQQTGIDTNVKHSMVRAFRSLCCWDFWPSNFLQNPFDEIGVVLFFWGVDNEPPIGLIKNHLQPSRRPSVYVRNTRKPSSPSKQWQSVPPNQSKRCEPHSL